MRKRAVARAGGVADILVQDKVQSRDEKEALGELALVRGQHAEAVLKYFRPVQVRTEGGFDLEHVEAEVLGLEADEIALVTVQDRGLRRLLERRHQIGFVFLRVRRRVRVPDGDGFGKLASRQQAVEVAVELSQIGKLVGRDRQ